jgi:hypothetical protein
MDLRDRSRRAALKSDHVLAARVVCNAEPVQVIQSLGGDQAPHVLSDRRRLEAVLGEPSPRLLRPGEARLHQRTLRPRADRVNAT